jgi:hypothetical protein
MKKLRLDPDALSVTSFPTAAEPHAAPGTVAANEATSGVTCQTSCAGGGHCTCYPA